MQDRDTGELRRAETVAKEANALKAKEIENVVDRSVAERQAPPLFECSKSALVFMKETAVVEHIRWWQRRARDFEK
jgi:hypothetical protein